MYSLEIKGFDKFIKQMKQAAYTYPPDVNVFMSKESKKLINESKAASPYATFKKRWFTKTRNGPNAGMWKGIFNKAPHLHLVEDGHRQVTHRPGLRQVGYVEGKHFLRPVVERFEPKFEADMEKFLFGIWDG